jgi:hypothetical protein
MQHVTTVLRDHSPVCALNKPAPEVCRCTCGVRSNKTEAE